MHILQIGAAKSGNLWLYKIIDQIFSKAEIPKKSYVQNRPIHSVAKTWPLSYPEQADIDMLDIRDRQCRWRISTIFQMPVEDIGDYISRSSHIWTHSRICDRSLEVYPLFDRIFYIVRDPRDRAVSEAKFAFSDYMQRFDPPESTSPQAYLDQNLEAMMNRWRWHVYDHLRYRNHFNIHVVFYERLLEDFEAELERMLDYLGIDLGAGEKAAIAESVTFSSMKKESPDHLRKGRTGDWQSQFTGEQITRSEQMLQPLMGYLNYGGGVPRVPVFLDRAFLEAKVDVIGENS